MRKVGIVLTALFVAAVLAGPAVASTKPHLYKMLPINEYKFKHVR